MSNQAYDINIEQGQRVTKNATVLISVDLFEINEQTFGVAAGTVTMYDGDEVADANVTALAIVVGTGLRSSVRVEFTIQAAWTSGLTASDDYSLVWTLTMDDGQTRLARQALEIRAV